MSTFNNKEFIDKMIAKNGKLYNDEPGATKIVEYINDWGNIAWGVVWETDKDQDKYRESEYVHSPRVIWTKS